MKKLLLLLLLVPAQVFASSADSGRCPWKMPFTIRVQAAGSDHRYELARTLLPGRWYEHDSDYGTTPSTDGVTVTVDTSGSYLSDSVHFSLKDDTLQYSRLSPRQFWTPVLISVSIVFARGKDSIISMQASTLDAFGVGGPQGWNISYVFAISNLVFNDSMIYCPDTSFQRHSVSFTHSNEQIKYYSNDYDYDEYFDVFTATNVTLAGIFRPIMLGPSPPAPPVPGTGCPWKVPFTIEVHAAGETYTNGSFVPQDVGSTIALNNDAVPDTENFSFTVDSFYSLKNDTLRYKGGSDSASVLIAFKPGSDSILSISCSNTVNGRSNYFQISSLQFDSTGIFVADSSFRNHKTSITVNGGGIDYVGPHQYFADANNFVAYSAKLSGIFRPTDLKDSTATYNPLHIPFEIAIRGEGSYDSSWGMRTSTDMSITVWCSSPANPNSFSFRSGGIAHDTSLEIDFVPNTDSVSEITLSVTNTFFMDGPGSTCSPLGDEWHLFTTTSRFEVHNLVYDSTSISSMDSSFCAHHISMSISNVDDYDCDWQLSSSTNLAFTATSATLSGIFRPTHYTCAESVSEAQAQVPSLRVVSSDHELNCSFAASEIARELEVYSILGTRVASQPVQIGEREATVFGLSPGLYFVRLGDAFG